MRSSVAEIPARFAPRTLDTYVPETHSQRAALQAARRLLAGEIDGLVLVGPTGVGKSHLAAGVANAIEAGNAARAADRQTRIDAWNAQRAELLGRRPAYPPPSPESRAALDAWRARRAESESRRAEWDAIREDHWNRQPKEPRPSPAWDAWDAEARDLAPKMREILGEPVGPTPVVEPTAEAMAEYRAATETWNAEMRALEERRPKAVREPEPAWVNVASLILGLRAEIDTEDRHHQDLAASLRHHPGLVVLDDLGRERTSDWTGETVYAVVNSRYEAILPTLVTSNLTAAELAASPYWPAISRLAEDGALVEIAGPDHRLRRGK